MIQYRHTDITLFLERLQTYLDDPLPENWANWIGIELHNKDMINKSELEVIIKYPNDRNKITIKDIKDNALDVVEKRFPTDTDTIVEYLFTEHVLGELNQLTVNRSL